MKQMKLHQDSVKWEILGLKALNAHTGLYEDITNVPNGKFVGIKIADKYDVFNESSISEVSEATSSYVMRHGKKRDYILFKDGRAIGWATFHREERNYKVTMEITYEDETIVRAKSEHDAMRKADALYAMDFPNARYIALAVGAELAE